MPIGNALASLTTAAMWLVAVVGLAWVCGFCPQAQKAKAQLQRSQKTQTRPTGIPLIDFITLCQFLDKRRTKTYLCSLAERLKT